MVLMTSKPWLIEQDPWLEPNQGSIEHQQHHYKAMRERIIRDKSLVEFASGHDFFGLHKTKDGWVFREWLPNATEVYLAGEFSDWQDESEFKLSKLKDGVWELKLSLDVLSHKDLYKMHVHWPGGDGLRVPAWVQRTYQDLDTHDFSAQVWAPEEEYEWKHKFTRDPEQSPYIYEAHIGMASEKERVASAKEFEHDVLPRIVKAGYNTIQLMAIQEHPYYGSFGYHVSSLFAATSRFGTPEDIKSLVDAAHAEGVSVILDIVHSHAVKNVNEGLACLDGTETQYFRSDPSGDHPAWDSKIYDYGKSEVVHFLLSNCKYWLEEYRFDGYRFDGVTSMLYDHHGLGKDFTCYDDYYDSVDYDATSYLTLANQLIHEYQPGVLSIAEEMSGKPGLAASVEHGGIGFDYRLSMGIPDMWIKLLKETEDENWQVSKLMHELSQHRPEEKTISYAESHDQALVGDKTVFFRMADSKMYDSMSLKSEDLDIDRAIALHKLIRLVTSSLNRGGYLNFMGNEFGHPEWVDFPRAGNGWSYKYAKRQWNLVDSPKLKYKFLGSFDKAMMDLLGQHEQDIKSEIAWTTINDDDHVFSFMRGDLLFAFNFHPNQSFEGYGVDSPIGDYELVLSSDDPEFGGFERIDKSVRYSASEECRGLKLYLPARTVLVLKRK